MDVRKPRTLRPNLQLLLYTTTSDYYYHYKYYKYYIFYCYYYYYHENTYYRYFQSLRLLRLLQLLLSLLSQTITLVRRLKFFYSGLFGATPKATTPIICIDVHLQLPFRTLATTRMTASTFNSTPLTPTILRLQTSHCKRQKFQRPDLERKSHSNRARRLRLFMMECAAVRDSRKDKN